MLRTDTVLAHLKAQKLGRFAPVPSSPLAAESRIPVPEGVVVGARCRVGRDRRGVVRFVGEGMIGKGGVWVGVELDEPVGNGDGE